MVSIWHRMTISLPALLTHSSSLLTKYVTVLIDIQGEYVWAGRKRRVTFTRTRGSTSNCTYTETNNRWRYQPKLVPKVTNSVCVCVSIGRGRFSPTMATYTLDHWKPPWNREGKCYYSVMWTPQNKKWRVEENVLLIPPIRCQSWFFLGHDLHSEGDTLSCSVATHGHTATVAHSELYQSGCCS